MEVEKRLEEMGYTLPAPPTPGGNYVGAVQTGTWYTWPEL